MRSKRYRYKSYKPQKRRRAFPGAYLWLTILIIFLAGAFFYLLALAPFFQLKDVQVVGNNKVSSESLKNFIYSYIKKRVVFFDSQSIVLISLKQNAAGLKELFPQINQAYLKRVWPSTIRVTIEERAAVAAWCTEERCFSVDKEGIIFEIANPETSLIIKTENGVKGLNFGNPVIAQKLLDSILEINKSFKNELKTEVKEFFIPEEEKKLIVRAVEGWEAYFNPEQNIGDQVFNLKSVLNERIPSEKRGNLEYIDLRFGNKVYLKYRSVSS